MTWMLAGVYATIVLSTSAGMALWRAMLAVNDWKSKGDWRFGICICLFATMLIAIGVNCFFVAHRLPKSALPDEPYRTEINSYNEAIFVGTDAERHNREYKAFRLGLRAKETPHGE